MTADELVGRCIGCGHDFTTGNCGGCGAGPGPEERGVAINAEFARTFLSAAYNESNPLPPVWAQVLNVAGEAGEFVEAYRRYTGHARRNGSLYETSEELADVVISAYVAAERLHVDLDACIEAKQRVVMKRGFKDTAEVSS